MRALISPIVSEFETQEQEDSYDRWFRAKVQADPKLGMPHDEVMAERWSPSSLKPSPECINHTDVPIIWI
ncbi:hypothetical protein [Yersinia intermedia]|uniref:type II toxin-antitoxin system RelB family antitoxin n=1 Tax=Yersinia intermedia TaxID=631 RepID=UPI002244EF0A|nr:hypothetical protein [Yersinia intermedia]MCW8114079.1 hypothetical protein [Yersinia intermedia]MDA5518870.1 hypothetical protein [Yersinia intermedia]